MKIIFVKEEGKVPPEFEMLHKNEHAAIYFYAHMRECVFIGYSLDKVMEFMKANKIETYQVSILSAFQHIKWKADSEDLYVVPTTIGYNVYKYNV